MEIIYKIVIIFAFRRSLEQSFDIKVQRFTVRTDYFCSKLLLNNSNGPRGGPSHLLLKSQEAGHQTLLSSLSLVKEGSLPPSCFPLCWTFIHGLQEKDTKTWYMMRNKVGHSTNMLYNHSYVQVLLKAPSFCLFREHCLSFFV